MKLNQRLRACHTSMTCQAKGYLLTLLPLFIHLFIHLFSITGIVEYLSYFIMKCTTVILSGYGAGLTWNLHFLLCENWK